MKKYLILASAALVALAACNKEQEIKNPVSNHVETVLTFTSARPQLDAETKTAWNPNTSSIVWTSEDQIRVGYTFNDSWMGKNEAGNPKFYASDNVSIDSEDSGLGTFSVPGDFESPSTEGSYVFYGVYPKPAGTDFVSSESVATLTLPATQTPGAVTFDKTADIMIGKSAPKTLSALPTDPIEITWARIVAHADITFSNLGFVGTESVSSIKLTFDDNAKVAGTFTVNVKTGVVTAGSESEVLINGDNLVAGSNSVEAWCCLLPVTFSELDVEVKTDQATYTRSITGISKEFKKNGRNTLTVNMAQAKRTENAPLAYALYSGTITEGDYIIYYDGVALKAAESGDRLAYSSVSVSGNEISTNDGSIIWHIAPSGEYWTIYNSSAKAYAASTGAKNKAQLSTDSSDDKALWSISGTSTYEFVNKQNTTNSVNAILRYNAGFGFACYAATTGGALSLYKVDNRTPLDAPTSVSAELDGTVSNTINVTFSTVSDAASYVITATPAAGGDAIVKNGVTASPAAIEGLAYDTEYAISVYAVPASTDVDHKQSAATTASATVTTGPKPQNPEGYELITSTDDVTTGLYIIAAKIGENYIAMPNTLGTAPFAGSALTVENDFVSSTNASDFSLTITKNEDKFTIVGATSTLGYGSSTSFSTSASGDAALWTINSASTHGSFRIANVGTASRAIVYRAGSTNKFGAYSTGNISATGEYYDVELFKFNGTVVVKDTPTTTVTPASPIALEVGGTQQLSVSTNSDGAVSYESSDDDIATVTSGGLITAVAAGNATITVKTAETSTYKAGTTEITVNVSAGASTIAQVLSDGAGTYKLANLLVYAVNGKNAIVGDASGKMLLYMDNSLAKGDNISIANAGVVVFSGMLEITSGTINIISQNNTINHGTPVNLNDQTAAASTYTTFSATGYHSAQFISMTGNQSARNIIGSQEHTTLYLNVADDTYDGKTVAVTGYVYSWSSSHSNYNFQAVSIEEDTTTPTLSVSPSALNWAADATDSKTVTVTLNGAATGYSVSPTSDANWNIADDGSGTITVSPKAANTSTTDAKTLTLTITHKDSNTLSEQVNCTQAKVSSVDYEINGNLATFTFTQNSIPSNNTDFTATSGACPASTFRLNGSGSTWNTSKGYAFTSVTSVVVTVKAVKAFKKGATITLSMDTYYNKESNAPMKGFDITASESAGSSSTTGLNVTSWALSNSSTNKSVTYTIQNDVAVGGTVVFTLTGTGKAGAGQGYINNVKADYSDN